MTEPKPPPAPAQLRVSERKVVLLLCCLAAMHVFIFSAAFPFFNNVDEPMHFDLVTKYADGHFPKEMALPSDEALKYEAFFASLEYLYPDGSQISPPWTQPASAVKPLLVSREKHWKTPNHEASQTPLYYLIAGAWWRLCAACGLSSGGLLYMAHFLNMVFVGALVWLGWFSARLIFPQNAFLRFAVPILIACLPQTVFYSINNDVLSPLTFGLVFICVVRWTCAENPGIFLGAGTGLAFAATFLTKMTNLPMLFVAGVVLGFNLFGSWRNKRLRLVLPALVAFTICFVPFVVGWIAWCEIHFGDSTGSAAKIEMLGWTRKPFAEWFGHPIFHPRGFWIFLSGNLESFWQGETWWLGKSMSLNFVNMVYVAASIIFIAAALVNLLPPLNGDASPHGALLFAAGGLAAMFVFLGVLSIIYDFHDCVYPSREHPFFTSGRLFLGALIPFLLLFAFGLDCVLKRFGNAGKFSALTALLVFMLAGEIATDWPVFFSQYNWYHM